MPIRTAILGYGRSGSTLHANPLEKSDAFDVVATCDIDPERNRQASKRFGCTTYDNYLEMLEKEDLDLVCIVTRSDQHCAMTCDCLEAGVNVLVTKPWAVNTVEAERMRATAARTGRLLLPWLPARWGCDLRRLQTLVDQGAIGNVFLIRRVVSSFRTRCDWQTERKHGGGYLLNWGPHIIDPPIILMRSRVAFVYGRLKQTINPGDTEDLFFALLTLENGTIIQAEYTVSPEPFPSWLLQGTEGAIVVNDKHIRVRRTLPGQSDDPTQYSKEGKSNETIREETVEGSVYGDEHEIYAEVAQAIRGERPFPVAPEDALELSRILDAVRTADAENRVLTLGSSE
jgi:predicted dehydrogenase